MSKSKVKKIYDLVQFELDLVQNEIMMSLKSDEDLINQIGAHILGSPGKMIRPALLFLFSKMLGYHGSSHIKMAAAVELIHIGTLVHDDVVDNNDTRRFKPTANSIWDNSLSVLTGDYIFCAAFKLMVECRSIECLNVLANALSIIVSGEVSQLARLKSRVPITLEEYYKIVQAKTSELFMASCHIPAILTNQKQDTTQLILSISQKIGILFQIVDDIMDYFCDIDVIGKDRFNDFMEGKFTIPVIELMQHATHEDSEFIAKLLTKEDKTLSDAKYMLSLMQKYDISSHMKQLMNRIKLEAEGMIDQLTDNEYNRHLRIIIEYIISKAFS